MKRRPLLQSLAAGGGALLTAGCAESIPFTTSSLEPETVFDDYRFDGAELVVAFQDDVDVQSVTLLNSRTDETHERIDRPSGTVRFPVVFPDRMETYVGRSFRVEATTADGRASKRISGPVHPAVSTIEILPDGRARVGIENQTDAPLLVRYVGIYEDVPDPTVDPQADSMDGTALPTAPGVAGTESDRRGSRTDLVVPGGETRSFVTTYAPFAYPETEMAVCDGRERRGKIAIVRASGGSASYGFTYTLEGEPTAVDGNGTACDAGETSR